MRRAVLLALALAGAAVAQEPPPGAGPRGTSGEVHDDSVGIATVLTVTPGVAPKIRIAAMHASLPTGSFVEITALETGHTIAALVVGPYRGRGIVGLSPDAAQALGVVEGAAVRVRSFAPDPQDQTALRSGQAAGQRLDAPPALLVALRKKVAGGMAPPPARPERSRPTEASSPPRPAERGTYGVQVAALSSAPGAAMLARTLGGHVVASGRLYRVQLGPFADAPSAERARGAAARQGYKDARIFHIE